jgi:hypothetical protein
MRLRNVVGVVGAMFVPLTVGMVVASSAGAQSQEELFAANGKWICSLLEDGGGNYDNVVNNVKSNLKVSHSDAVGLVVLSTNRICPSKQPVAAPGPL